MAKQTLTGYTSASQVKTQLDKVADLELSVGKLSPSQKIVDFAICDENGKAILIVNDGHIITKNFNSGNSKGNVLDGKILCTCGDSITQGIDIERQGEGLTNDTSVDFSQWSVDQNDWIKQTTNIRMTYGWQIAKRNNMKFYNGGVSGSTMQGIEDRYGFSISNGRYTKLPDEIDYLTIFFGWNDNSYGTLGTIDDSTNDTFYGGYNVVLPYLINKYPYTKIALIVPFGTSVGHRQAVRNLANKYGLAYFDFYAENQPLYYGKEANVNVLESVVNANRTKFQYGAHPLYKGHVFISTMIENFLRSL